MSQMIIDEYIKTAEHKFGVIFTYFVQKEANFIEF